MAAKRGPDGLPRRPTPAQKRAAEALALTPAEQRARWKTTSTRSPRLVAYLEALADQVRRSFPDAEPVLEYNMHGWRIPRAVQVQEWKGTIDPNWVRIFVAERKQGISIHLWEPFGCLKEAEKALREAGFKPMVGCIQYNRKGDVPMEPVVALLAEVADRMAAEA